MSTPDFIPQIGIADDEFTTAQDDFDAASLDGEDPDVIPIVTGRAPIFDWPSQSFSRQSSNGAPMMHSGVAAIEGWIVKCIATERDSSPVHPPGYGLEGRTEMLGKPIDELDIVEVAEHLDDALTFHPRIVAVDDVQVFIPENDDTAYLSCTATLDTDEQLTVYTPFGANDA